MFAECKPLIDEACYRLRKYQMPQCCSSSSSRSGCIVFGFALESIIMAAPDSMAPTTLPIVIRAPEKKSQKFPTAGSVYFAIMQAHALRRRRDATFKFTLYWSSKRGGVSVVEMLLLLEKEASTERKCDADARNIYLGRRILFAI